MSALLKQYPRFIDLVDEIKNSTAGFVDYAQDGTHPGPRQHQIYFERILNFIEADKHG
jgi:phospholipase/lecithinase/hemolysin